MGQTASKAVYPTNTGLLLLFSCIIASAFNLRTAVTSITPLLEVVRTEFDFSTTLMGVLGMLPTIAFALAAAITRPIIVWLNLERTAILSMVLAALGLALRSGSGSTDMLFLSSFIALVGMGIGNAVLPPLVKRYFFHHLGTVSTIYITALQVGTLLPPFLAVPVAVATNWRISLGLWVLPALLALSLWAITWYKEPALRRQPSLKTQQRRTESNAVWKAPIAWGMAMMFSMTSLNTYSMFTWLPAIFTSAGASAEFGGAMVGVFASLGIISSLLAPWLAVRLANVFPVIVFCCCCFWGGYLGLYFAPLSYPFIWITLVGLAPSTFPLALTLINLRSRTAEGSAALSAFMQAVGYSVSAIGPLLFAMLHDYTHTWRLSFIFLGSCVIILLLGGWLVSRRQYIEDQW